MLNTIALKPFLTSAVKVLTWLLATTTKICTNVWSRQDHSLSPSYQIIIFTYITQAYMLLYNSVVFYNNSYLYVCTLSAPLIFKAIAFVRWVVTHLLSRFRLPWPLPWCLHTTTLFLVSNNECTIWHFKIAFDSSRITHSAYQKRSTNRKKYLIYKCF